MHRHPSTTGIVDRVHAFHPQADNRHLPTPHPIKRHATTRGPSNTHEHELPTQRPPSSHSLPPRPHHLVAVAVSEQASNNGGGSSPAAAGCRAPPPRPPPNRRGGIVDDDINDEPHQDGGGAGDGEPVVRPHAWLDEAAEPRDRRRDGPGVEPGQHVGPVVGARLLRRRRGVRGPGPGPLVPGDPAADLRLRRRVRPGPDGRLRAAGGVHRRRQHDRRRHARLRPRQRRRVPRAGVAVRRLRPVVRVRAVVHAAQQVVRPLRNVRRRHQQQPDVRASYTNTCCICYLFVCFLFSLLSVYIIPYIIIYPLSTGWLLLLI